MRKILLATTIALLTLLPLRVLAATPGEFHASLLRRGITAYDAGRHQDAVKNLRLAAFGFVESIEQYQTAHAYLALAYDKLKDATRTRDSLRRIVQAERVERRFGAVAFPPEVRAAVLGLAGRVLPAGEVEMLRTSPPRVATTTTTTTTAPPASTTTTRPSGGVTPPSQPARTPALPEPKPATQPAQTQPAQTQPAQPRPVPSNQQPATSNPSQSTTTPPRTTTTAPSTAPPTTTTTTPPRTTTTAPPTTTTTTPPRTTSPQPQPQAATITAGEIANRMLAADRALTAANLTEARRLYRELLNANGVPRETLIRVAEGFYRARDFAGALAAFDRVGALRRGEEPYRYYIAVAAHETGQHERARRELAAALPFIEITPDVARYKAKIEGAQN